MGIKTFFNTVGIIHRNNFVSDFSGISRHIIWQARKALNLFPFELAFSRSKILVQDGRCSVSALVNCQGLYDPNNMRFLRDVLKSAPVDFLDVGANIGSYTLLASEYPISVASFEPFPQSYERLRNNLELNSRHNVRAFPYALGETEQKLFLKKNKSSAMNRISSESEGGEGIHIQVLRGDTVLEREGIRPGFIKIDTEGHELFVLRGLERCLDHAIFILVEISQQKADVLALLKSHGFSGPYAVDYRGRRLVRSEAGGEDPLFIKHSSSKILSALGFVLVEAT